MAFDYPESRASRRHGPRGYSQYESYRPWLRDEFSFRCVYCLRRERWGQVTGEFELDHFVSQATSPEASADYENLVYACGRCNRVKLDQAVPDPFATLTAKQVWVHPDGTLRAETDEANRLILQLDLNSPRLVAWRLMWMRIVQLAAERDPELLEDLMGYPADLPNLVSLRPPEGNSRPQGIQESWLAQRERGQLPSTY